MNNKKGVSMIEIIISIIILLIIAFFAVYNSRNSVGKAKLAEVYSEMISVQNAVEYVKSRMITENNFALEEGVHYDDEVTVNDKEYKWIYGYLNHDACPSAENLGLNSLKRDYLIDYDDGDFMLKDYVDIQGIQVRTLQEVNSLRNSGI